MSAQTLKSAAFAFALASTAVALFFLWSTWQVFVASQKLAAELKAPLPDRTTAATATPTLLALDEIYVSLGAVGRPHSFVVGMDLELFDQSGRDTVDRLRPAVRHAILEAAMEQKFDELRTLAGKLYFKEVVVSRINTLLNRALVRDAHFTAFYLQ